MNARRWGIVLGALGAAAAATFLIHRVRASGFAWREFAKALQQVSWPWLVAALALVLSTYVGRALRWEVMLRPLAKNSSFRRILTGTCIGFAAVVMFGRAGEPVRPYLIARSEGVTFSSQLAAWVVERILDLLMILIIFGLALSQLAHSSIRSSARIENLLKGGGAAAGLTGVICLALLVGMRQFRGRIQERLLDGLAFLPQDFLTKVAKFLAAFDEGMQSIRSTSYTLLLVWYTIVEWGLIGGCFYCVFRAFPLTAGLGVTDILIVLGFVAFGSVVQIPGVGGGMQIVCILILTQFYGIPLEAASSIALTLWVISFLAILPPGLALAFKEGLKWRNLRHIEASL